jgi:hypothetical protein
MYCALPPCALLHVGAGQVKSAQVAHVAAVAELTKVTMVKNLKTP